MRLQPFAKNIHGCRISSARWGEDGLHGVAHGKSDDPFRYPLRFGRTQCEAAIGAPDQNGQKRTVIPLQSLFPLGTRQIELLLRYGMKRIARDQDVRPSDAIMRIGNHQIELPDRHAWVLDLYDGQPFASCDSPSNNASAPSDADDEACVFGNPDRIDPF